MENSDKWGMQILLTIVYLLVGAFLHAQGYSEGLGAWMAFAGITFTVLLTCMWYDGYY